MIIMVMLNMYQSSHIVRLANNTDEWETMKDDGWEAMAGIVCYSNYFDFTSSDN